VLSCEVACGDSLLTVERHTHPGQPMPREGEAVTLRTLLHVREDLLQLFGFATDAERLLFVRLIGTVTGIGPKLGLNILSAMSVETFCAHIVNRDTKALAKISGIGKRTAERLVVELSGKLDDIAPAVAITGKPAGEPGAAPTLNKAAEDAVSGLVTLGLKPDVARKTVHQLVQELPAEQVSAEKLIRLALNRANT
jgi:Holliday junction DNA helicase RuvA